MEEKDGTVAPANKIQDKPVVAATQAVPEEKAPAASTPNGDEGRAAEADQFQNVSDPAKTEAGPAFVRAKSFFDWVWGGLKRFPWSRSIKMVVDLLQVAFLAIGIKVTYDALPSIKKLAAFEERAERALRRAELAEIERGQSEVELGSLQRRSRAAKDLLADVKLREDQLRGNVRELDGKYETARQELSRVQAALAQSDQELVGAEKKLKNTLLDVFKYQVENAMGTQFYSASWDRKDLDSVIAYVNSPTKSFWQPITYLNGALTNLGEGGEGFRFGPTELQRFGQWVNEHEAEYRCAVPPKVDYREELKVAMDSASAQSYASQALKDEAILRAAVAVADRRFRPLDLCYRRTITFLNRAFGALKY